MKDFNELFQQAAAIKQSQMHQQRKTFEKLPIFIKTGLYYSQKYEDCKLQAFAERLKVAEELKEKGNSMFKLGQFQEAAHEYEQSLSIFKYIENKNRNWKNEGIKDDDLSFIEYDGENEEEIALLKDLKNKLYLNMAACYLRSQQLKESLLACDYAIQVVPSAKGYFRRAKARLENINADEDDYEQAIQDLKQATSLDPDDPGIHTELQLRKNELQAMKKHNRILYQNMVRNKTDQMKDMNKQLIDRIVEKVDELDLNPKLIVKDSLLDRLKIYGIIAVTLGIVLFMIYARFIGPDL